MNSKHVLGRLAPILIHLVLFFDLASAQEAKTYSNAGVAFEYLSGWEMTEQSVNDAQQISLANKDADSQILIIILRKQSDSKDAMAALKKKVIDPWLTELLDQYTKAGINFSREDSKTEIAGQVAEGSTLKFVLDEQPGRGEAYWIFIQKRLVLLYFIRPDKSAEKASVGWDTIRNSLRVEAVKNR